MSRWLILSAVPDESDADKRIAEHAAAAAALTGVQHCSAGADLPGSTGGLGVLWDLTADIAPDAALSNLIGEAVSLDPVAASIVPMDTARRVKRTLLLTVRAGTPSDVVEQFEADLLAMPTHIDAIKSWSLSRVPAPSRWTHAWEQEFTSPDGLNGDYLLHPYHWTHVDRWFDPEIPGSIVEPNIAHLYRWANGPVLGD